MSVSTSFKDAWLSSGPFFAGVHVFVQLCYWVSGWLTLGGVAIWIRDHWIEATRVFWETVFSAFPKLSLTDPDKDALTAIAFFLPLSISAIIAALKSRNEGSEDAPSRSVLSSYGFRVLCLLLAIAILYLVARQVIDDVQTIVSSAKPDQNVFQWVLVASFSLLFVYAVAIVTLYFRKAGGLKKILTWGGTSAGVVQLLLLVLPTTASLIIAAQSLGALRMGAVVIVLTSIMLTAIVRPQRIIQLVTIVCLLVTLAISTELFTQLTGNFEN